MTTYAAGSRRTAHTACAVLESAGVGASYAFRKGEHLVTVDDEDEARAFDILRDVAADFREI